MQRPCFLPRFADEPDTAARQGLDQALLVPAVANGTSNGIDAGAECGFGHDSATPNRFDQLVAADDAVTVTDQIFEKVEDLRFDVDGTAAGAQFAPVRVHNEIVE